MGTTLIILGAGGLLASVDIGSNRAVVVFGLILAAGALVFGMAR